MEYVYAAMILHSIGKEINEKNITKILEASGANVDETRVKSLITALEGIDIDEAIESATVPAAQAAAAPTEVEEVEKPSEEEEEKEEKEEEEIAGLGDLFG